MTVLEIRIHTAGYTELVALFDLAVSVMLTFKYNIYALFSISIKNSKSI